MLTGHKVAIKILNRRKIQAMDMDEKGEGGLLLLLLCAAACCAVCGCVLSALAADAHPSSLPPPKTPRPPALKNPKPKQNNHN